MIHVCDSHWALVSTIGCPEGVVKLYDSFYTSLSSKTATIIAQLLRHKHLSITVQVMNVSKQIGTQDCALFAIAYLVALAFNEDPTAVVFDQDE